MSLSLALVLVGDLLTGRGVAPALQVPQNSLWRYQALLAGADLTLGNLEAAPKTARSGRKPFYNPGDLSVLRTIGFDGFSLANNHALDAGESGARQTQSQLQQLHLKSAGLSLDGATSIPIWNVNGRQIAVVAATQWGPFQSGRARLTRLDVAALSQRITALCKQNIFVVASLHWGTEGLPETSSQQRQIAHQLIDAGAVAVWGHHSHVAGAVETYRNRPIFASTGNFLWDDRKTAQSGLLVRLQIAGATPQNAKVTWKSWRIAPHARLESPPPTPRGETRLGAYSGRFDADNARLSWILWTQSAARKPILRALEKTANGWRVRATGFPREIKGVQIADFNGDGRDDFVVELRQRSKLDPTIQPRLHIYALDENGFRPLWRGSMLSRPFTQWQLIGRNDDTSSDLAALERGLNHTFWLTVYRWNGFGLRAVWQRRFAGELRDLRGGCDEKGVFLSFRADAKMWRARREGSESWRVAPVTIVSKPAVSPMKPPLQ